jgi:hypothetical protein
VALAAIADELAGGRPPAVAELRDRLYATLHCRTAWPVRVRTSGGGAAFEERLHAANHGVGPWQTGWTVREALPEGLVHAERDGLPVWVRADRLRGDPTPGASVAVRIPNALRRFSPGYYVAVGDAVAGDHIAHVRCYWHLRAEGAPVALDRLTRVLNAAEVAFRFKVLLDPARYPRTDAGVLYLPTADLARSWALVADVYADLASHLVPTTSLFVHPVAPGVGAADDISSGASFGLGRAQTLADVVLALGDAGRDAARMAEAITAAGIDPARPFAASSATVFPTWH